MNKLYNAKDIEIFLTEVDKSFPVPLSDKQDIKLYAQKLFDKATICAELDDGKIISLVAGYTDNMKDNIAYFSVAATTKEGRGRGLATKLFKEFLSICKDKNLDAAELYTDKRNVDAIRLYEKIGFQPYVIEDDPRPDDVHMIYYIKK
ncbi:MAG: GNAT family N-acetyltransferase [Eubacteriales bacterium]|nr:GNAT family N-acetyltransferase [Eubacteriales bacterium]